ncbi:MAG: 50S ribosomal protein L25 [Ardenticatenaceae bacterium]
MSDLTLSAQTRTVIGKKVKRLRRDGIVPIVVYGGPLKDGLALQVNDKSLKQVLRTAQTTKVINLKIDNGKNYPVLARSVDRHPTRHSIMHADFQAVHLDQPTQAIVPVKLVGSSPLVTSKIAVLRQVLHEVTILADNPRTLPSAVNVDVSILERIGQTISVGDIELGATMKILTDSKAQLARLNAPKRIQEVEEEEEEEGGEEES